jgi:predicted dehydrogenase
MNTFLFRLLKGRTMSVRIAFIGAGGIATKHLTTLEDRDDADVVGICDIDEETARSAAEAHDAAAFTEYERLFDEVDFDAVVIAVPPFAHEGQEQRAAEEGVHMLVEKPLGLAPGQPREIERAIEDAGILTQVGHMFRYHPIVERAMSLVGDRTLAYVDGRWLTSVPGAAWWRRYDQSGGQVVEQATHTYDLVRYFGGDVETVRAAGSQRVRTTEIDFPDATSATLTHENGMVSHVAASSASDDGENSLTIVGDGVHLDLDFSAKTLTGTVDGEAVSFETDSDPHRLELEAFIEDVAAGDPDRPRSPYADARKTFETTLAVNRSIETGEVVDVGSTMDAEAD